MSRTHFEKLGLRQQSRTSPGRALLLRWYVVFDEDNSILAYHA